MNRNGLSDTSNETKETLNEFCTVGVFKVVSVSVLSLQINQRDFEPCPGGGGVLSKFVRRGCAVFQGIVFAHFF